MKQLYKGTLKLANLKVTSNNDGINVKNMSTEQIINQMLAHWREHVFGEGKEDDTLFINKPTYELDNSNEDDIFAFSGFVKPGKHNLLIFDPENGFYEIQNYVIDQRSGEISTHKDQFPLENDRFYE